MRFPSLVEHASKTRNFNVRQYYLRKCFSNVFATQNLKHTIRNDDDRDRWNELLWFWAASDSPHSSNNIKFIIMWNEWQKYVCQLENIASACSFCFFFIRENRKHTYFCWQTAMFATWRWTSVFSYSFIYIRCRTIALVVILSLARSVSATNQDKLLNSNGLLCSTIPRRSACTWVGKHNHNRN